MDKPSDTTNENQKEEKGQKSSAPSTERPECAVCLQPCVHPVQLPCRHIFCYLCVKGVSHRSKRCAMCRQEIPPSYLDNPVLVQCPQANTAAEDDYQWFYEGRNGWWQYDERTSSEIESAYQKGEKQCEVLIAGFLYVIDFEERHQYRRCDPYRQRRVKRDLSSVPKKGIAGIRIASDSVAEQGAHSSDSENVGENSSGSSQALSNAAGSASDSEILSPEATDDLEHSSDVANNADILESAHEADSSQETRRSTRNSGRKN